MCVCARVVYIVIVYYKGIYLVYICVLCGEGGGRFRSARLLTCAMCVCVCVLSSPLPPLPPASHNGAVLSNGSPSAASLKDEEAAHALEEGAKMMADIQEKYLSTEKGFTLLY